MAKDRNNDNDKRNKKKKRRHDNSPDDKYQIDKDSIDEEFGDDKEKKIKSQKDALNKEEEELLTEEEQLKKKEEELKKKKAEILRKKIELAKQFDDFKMGIYEKTGLDQIEILRRLQELEGDSTIKPEASLSRIRVFLQEINQVRQELARLDSNLAGAIFYENEVFPLLNSLFFLAGMAGDLSLVARNLIQVSLAKNSKIEDSIALTYRMVRLADRMFNLLEAKIYKLIRILSVNE